MTDTATATTEDPAVAEMITVRYVRNATDQATGSISFHDDDREPLVLGAVGKMTELEMHQAIAAGLVMEVVEEDPNEPSDESPVEEVVIPEPITLERMTTAELRDVAKAEDIDVTGLRKPADIVAAIEQARTPQEETPAEAPAAE